VQYAAPPCQLGRPTSGDSRLISPQTDGTPCPETPLVHGTARQTIEHTASRRTGPQKWLRAIEWLIGAGLHPQANATTRRIAEDLAARMDYDTGHARYCLDETAARLEISRASVKRHVRYLRELGALAWVQHGTRHNIRRAMGLKGYAATATIYAAVIPAAFDHAMGHTIVGSGYTARIIIDMRTQAPKPVDTAGNSPVDNSADEGLEPPSLTVVKEESQVQLVGGFNYTSQARPPKTRIPNQSSLINGRRRTATDVQKASNETKMVRALVNWTQPVPLRKLEHVLRPWTDRGWDAFRIADELNGMCAGVRWRPKNPVAFIRARIAADTQHQADLAAAIPWQESTAYREQQAARAALAALLGAEEGSHTVAVEEPARTDEDRKWARMDWDNWPQVADHYADDPDDALDLYGKRLCSYAVGQQARMNEREGAWA
jgi:AraC-like DNA-binding protein